MVISQIIGGLGNQMFQYAAGRALALRKDTTLELDVSGFANYGLHQGFELQRVFGDRFEIASAVDIRRVLRWQSPVIVRRVMSRRPFASFCGNRFVAEPHFHYWSGINGLTKDCYLSGYWQSEKYFDDIASQIRADFTFQLSLENKNAELAEQIKQVNAVSLHVRRGDYITNPQNAHYEICSLEYYLAAVEYIKSYIKEPYFFVFSDDINWVKASLPVDAPVIYVDHNFGKESYNDMRLMSLCKHNIIANSSFSWWGAWLNQKAGKIVIAPKQWFSKSTDTSDLIPASWVRL